MKNSIKIGLAVLIIAFCMVLNLNVSQNSERNNLKLENLAALNSVSAYPSELGGGDYRMMYGVPTGWVPATYPEGWHTFVSNMGWCEEAYVCNVWGSGDCWY